MASETKPHIDFKALKSSISMADVLSRYGHLDRMEEKKNGTQLVGPSPFREGKSRTSFKVDPAKECWYDFGLKKGGSVIDFVAVKEGVGIREAAERLVGWFAEDEKTPPDGSLVDASALDIFTLPPLDRAQVFFALSLSALAELDEGERQRQTIRFAKALLFKLEA